MTSLSHFYGLNETFGPQPPKPTQDMKHLDVARLRGMAWVYDTGEHASDEQVSSVLRMSSAPRALEAQMVKAWREGEKEQMRLGNAT